MMIDKVFKKIAVVLLLIGGSTFIAGAQNTFPSTGNVGIGTTSPFLPLDVRGLSTFSDQLYSPKGYRVSSSSTDLVNGCPWYGMGKIDSSAFGNSLVQLAGFFGLYFRTGNAQMILTESGNVGIGTVNPQASLDITSSFLFYNGRNGDPTLKFHKTGWSRINAPDNLSIWANGRGDSDDNPQLFIGATGNVGIGITAPTQKLTVDGNVKAQGVIVTTSGWPDYVFNKGYRLPSLNALSEQIKTEGHLPDLPSAQEVETNGQSLGEMNKKLLQKVEELTLYLIEQKKQCDKQQQEIDALKQQNKEILTLVRKNK